MALITLLSALACSPSAQATTGQATFVASSDPSQPLRIVPYSDPETVTLGNNVPIYGIQRMPVDKTVSSLTFGDLGQGSCDSASPAARLFVYDQPTHDFDSGNEIAYTGWARLPASPSRLTWTTFDWTASGGALPLQAGHTYRFDIQLDGCSSFTQKTWQAKDPMVETPDATCISGVPYEISGIGGRRQWHDGSTTGSPACVNWPTGQNDWQTYIWPYLDDGWVVSVSPGSQSMLAEIEAISGGEGIGPCGYSYWAGSGIRQHNIVTPTGWEGNPYVGYHRVPELNGFCYWDHFHDPGEVTSYGWSTALPFNTRFGGAPRLPYVSLGEAPAQRFEPILRFDKGEKWRPLNIDVFLNEHNPIDGTPVQCLGASRETCMPVDGLNTLRDHASTSDRIFQGDWYTSGTPNSADDYRTTDTTCALSPPDADHPLQDCDSGPAATIYYSSLTRSAGYNYYDYWFFYRYNDFVADHHEADWEHVTVAPSMSNPMTFDWVNFFQHAYSSDYSSSSGGLGGSYLRANLSCDGGGPSSCGSDQDGSPHGQRVWVYVAGGTHASYPIECDSACSQPHVASLEGDHGGQAPWGANDDPSSLVEFPAPVGWSDPAQANWTDWPGRWGQQGIPQSPGSNRSFKCPWEGNPADATACSAKRRRTTRRAEVTGLSSECKAWYGDAVIAAACSPSRLDHAVHQGRVGSKGRVRLMVSGHGRRSASGAGIAQAVGTPLTGGSKIVVRGRWTGDTELLVRAKYGATQRQWILHALPTPPGRLTIRLPRSAEGKPRVEQRKSADR